MNDPARPERHEKFLNGVNEVLDDLGKRAVFAPHHCEECGTVASEYFTLPYMTVCASCLRPEDKKMLDRKKVSQSVLKRGSQSGIS